MCPNLCGEATPAPDSPDPAATGVRVTYSTVHPYEIAGLVAAEYGLGTPTGCRLMHSGFNDTYDVQVGGQRFALRLHRRGKEWIAGESDLRFELDLLTHLYRQYVPVSRPVPRGTGDLLGRFAAPEGDRCYTLFTWARGAPVVEYMTPQQARTVGATLAAIHVAADSFATSHTRYALDESGILDPKTQNLGPQLAGLPKHETCFIREQVEQIRQALRRFDPGPGGWGIIHGDVQGLNYHFADDDAITFFDFDLCGWGWRAYDVAYYYTRIRQRLRADVLAGYEAVRPLNPAERDMLPTLGRAAWVWEGIHPASLIERLHDPYIPR